jgi:hypothetical protein
MTAATQTYDHDQCVMKFKTAIEAGKMNPQAVSDDWLKKSKTGTVEQLRKAIADATSLIAYEREKEQERQQTQKKADLRAKFARKKKQLVEQDTAVAIPAEQLDRMEAVIRSLMDQDILDDYNEDLKKKSGTITFRDIAFIGCVHYLSVSSNGQADPRHNFSATSPMKRISKASVSFNYRQTPFDNRQIRYALEILSVLNFTREVEAAVYWGPKDKRNRAAKWSVCFDEAFNGVF